MGGDSSISQLKDLIGEIKDNFWLERQQSGKNDDEIQQEWIASMKGLTNVLGMPSSNESISALPSSSGFDFSYPASPTSLGPVTMQRRRTVSDSRTIS